MLVISIIKGIDKYEHGEEDNHADDDDDLNYDDFEEVHHQNDCIDTKDDG